MSLSIRYSLRARQEQIDLLEYIIKNFGKAKAKEVYDKVERVLGEISRMPEMYPVSKRNQGLRKCVFSKQTSIYYRVHEEYIEIISFRPNRSNTSKL